MGLGGLYGGLVSYSNREGGGRNRVLIALPVNGPMYVRQIGRLTGIDSHKCFDMIGHLADAGLVVAQLESLQRERATNLINYYVGDA